MNRNDTDSKDKDIADTGKETESKKDDIHVKGNIACAISSVGQLAVAAVTSPITAQSVTDMKITAANVPINQANADLLTIRASNISGMLIYSY